MLKVLKAVDKFSPLLMSSPKMRARPRMAYPIVEMKLNLTNEEYTELGKPGLRQILELDIVKVKEE
jgi:hypothetical protein